MSKKKKQKQVTYQSPEQIWRARQERARSGAAGTHADQKARKDYAVGGTNRQGSRKARLQSVLRDQRQEWRQNKNLSTGGGEVLSFRSFRGRNLCKGNRP